MSPLGPYKVRLNVNISVVGDEALTRMVRRFEDHPDCGKRLKGAVVDAIFQLVEVETDIMQGVASMLAGEPPDTPE
jgi:hypothetical protein